MTAGGVPTGAPPAAGATVGPMSSSQPSGAPDVSDAPDAVGVRLALEGPLAVVTLARPEVRNAQTPATWRALAGIAAGLPADVRVVILRAEGTSFSAGIDRRMFTPQGIPGETSFTAMAGLDDAALDAAIASAQEAFTCWRRPEWVTVAAVQGHAVGAGFQLALACDLRVVADDASFSMREPALGLVPDLTGTKPLVEIVGYSRALEICATARNVPAAEAGEVVSATVVVSRAELDQTVGDLVAALTAPMAGAVSETKALLQSAHDLSLDEQRRLEREAQVRRFRELAGLMAAG